MIISSNDFIESYLNDNDDMQVIPVSNRDGQFFKRVKSGHLIEVGWDSRFYYDSVFSVKPREMSEEEYLVSLNLTVSWLPKHRNQTIVEQVQHHNLYYTVGNTDKLPDWRSTKYFFCSPFSFFPEESLIQQEWRRLRGIEKCKSQIQLGKEAQTRLQKLEKSGPLAKHPVMAK